MRIAIGQIWQESNTFNPLPTTREDFEAFGVVRGDDLVRLMADTNELGGFIHSLRAWPERPDIVGLVRLPAWPSGRATAETFDWIHHELLSHLQQVLPVDGVLLALHGALAADQHPDAEGELLTAVRALVGPTTPVVATLDLHAHVTERKAAAADALVLFHTIPHVDVFETGQRAAAVLRRIIVEHARPVTALAQIPCVLPAERASTEASSGISTDLKRQLQSLESQANVMSAGIATVQPWLDVPGLCSAALVTTDDDPAAAQASCAQLANRLWEHREDYLPELFSVEEAVARAHAHRAGLVVLSDAADATTSGAPGDSVWVLQELRKYEWERPVLLTVVAPEIVASAESLGVGATWTGRIGGLRDHRFGTTITLAASVERLFDSRFVLNGHIGKNLAIDMGRAVVLRTGQIRVLVTSRSGPHFAPELFRAAGFDPFAASVVVAKSPAGFRAVYGSQTAAIYSVRAPGCAPSNFWEYEYKQIRHPVWPWDQTLTWQAEPQIVRSRVAAT